MHEIWFTPSQSEEERPTSIPAVMNCTMRESHVRERLSVVGKSAWTYFLCIHSVKHLIQSRRVSTEAEKDKSKAKTRIDASICT